MKRWPAVHIDEVWLSPGSTLDETTSCFLGLECTDDWIITVGLNFSFHQSHLLLLPAPVESHHQSPESMESSLPLWGEDCVAILFSSCHGKACQNDRRTHNRRPSQGPWVYKISALLCLKKKKNIANVWLRCAWALWGQFPVNDDIMYGGNLIREIQMAFMFTTPWPCLFPLHSVIKTRGKSHGCCNTFCEWHRRILQMEPFYSRYEFDVSSVW